LKGALKQLSTQSVNTGISSVMLRAERDNRRLASYATSSNVMDFRWSPFVTKVVAERTPEFRNLSKVIFFIFGRHV
jgi:hypothetical protein